jgi:branched-chain amino acid transport system ATP-binding protein
VAAQARLAEVGLARHAHTPAGRLAHGQRRLLDIAMALAGDPRLLLLDEPAAGLDGEDLERLVALLSGLPADVAVLLVEHRLELVAAVAHSVTVLHQGRVLAAGRPEELARDPAVVLPYPGITALASGASDAAR